VLVLCLDVQYVVGASTQGAVKKFQAGVNGDMQFISVKGCGHTIPTYCPEAGFAMLDNWLNPENNATASP
jgi:hypothetical protein